MGVEKTNGTVVVGHFADIIAVRADVLENIAALQNVSLLMKGGVVYKQGGQAVESALGAR